jgi:protein-disulfide isomerase
LRNALIAIVVLIFVPGSITAQTSAPAPAPHSTTAPATAAPAPATPPTELQKRIESYIREVYAFGKDFNVKVGVPQPTPITDLSAVSIDISYNGQSDSTVVYVSKDGKFMLMHTVLDDLSVDPFAAARKLIQLEGAPTKGPHDARVVLVEYADYECPVCRQLNTLLTTTLLPKYPQIRLVYKDFPLADIHPWSMTATEAAHCAFIQSPSAYWKFHDSIFDNQDLISPTIAFDKLLDLATQAGLNPDAMRACMADPKTTQVIQAEQAEGQALEIDSTPTVFINGRRMEGANEQSLEQFIDYELAKQPSASKIP